MASAQEVAQLTAQPSRLHTALGRGGRVSSQGCLATGFGPHFPLEVQT